MANTYKSIVITPNRLSNTADPNISFRGGNTSSNTTITLTVYPDANGSLSFDGSAGQLFSITNDLSNSIFSVNDVSGIPSIEVFANGSVVLTGNVTVGATGSAAANTFSVGYLERPQNSKSAAYGTVLTDSGKHIFHPSSDNNARTFTIPANANVAYPTGTELTFINMANTVTIAITTDTMYLSGNGATGNRTLAANGIATAIKINSTAWLISGTGLT